MSNHPVIRQVTNLVSFGDLVAAEAALVAVAEEDGDSALVALLDSLPERDLIAILREYDSSHDTPVAALISPEKFARIVGLEALYDDKGHDRLKGMINAVLLRDEETTDDYIAAMAETEQGLFAFRDYFTDHHTALEYLAQHGRIDIDQVDCEDFSLEDAIGLEVLLRQEEESSVSTFAEHRDGDWMQIAWLLRHHHLDFFADILRLLRNRFGAQMETLEKFLAITGEKTLADEDDEESAL
ncbi:MAG TPA: hypothetical protein VJ001_02305 [Rhodocyclaceae bacterium]|nr:hypothetical protein [Rhodocyclaceae bacterium]